jgi:uncharacterized protein YggE
MRSPARLAAFAAIAAVVFVASLAATCGDTTTRVETNGNQEHGITVSGEGTAPGKPDIAMIILGVTRASDTVADARDGAATSLDAMIRTIQANGVAKEDIQTQQFNIQPEYDYRNGRQTLKGFRVSNTLSVKLRDIDRTGKVVDDAVNAGGNDTQVQSIAFTIDKPDELERQAREAAVADARAKAETLAKTAGLSLGDPITISESGGPQPVYAERLAFDSAAQAGAQPTPIEPGTLDVVINVSVTWAIQ